MHMKILLFSDIHYTVEETADELKKVYPSACASAASGKILGFTQQEKITQAKSDILKEHEKSPIDAIFVLGDLSIDDYSFRNLPKNYCKELKEKLFGSLPCPVFAIAGNHDSYPDEMWKEIFGYGRQYFVKLGDYVFIMADTFNSGNAKNPSGSKYTSPDISFIKSVMDSHKDCKFFICAHYFKNECEEDFLHLLNDERVICLFRGHTHIHECVTLKNGKKLFDIGGYGYSGFKTDYGYEFSFFDEKWAWGYEVVEIQKSITISHVTPKRMYNAKNGCFDISEKIETTVL